MVRRGNCCDRHTSGSSSQAAAAACRCGSGKSPQWWWSDRVCSTGSRYTVRSTPGGGLECCNSPGARVGSARVTCNWPGTVPAVPTQVSWVWAEQHCRVALCKVGSPSAAYRPGSDWRPWWRPRPRSSGNRRSTGCSALCRWGQVGAASSEGGLSAEWATACPVSWL